MRIWKKEPGQFEFGFEFGNSNVHLLASQVNLNLEILMFTFWLVLQGALGGLAFKVESIPTQ